MSGGVRSGWSRWPRTHAGSGHKRRRRANSRPRTTRSAGARPTRGRVLLAGEAREDQYLGRHGDRQARLDEVGRHLTIARASVGGSQQVLQTRPRPGCGARAPGAWRRAQRRARCSSITASRATARVGPSLDQGAELLQVFGAGHRHDEATARAEHARAFGRVAPAVDRQHHVQAARRESARGDRRWPPPRWRPGSAGPPASTAATERSMPTPVTPGRAVSAPITSPAPQPRSTTATDGVGWVQGATSATASSTARPTPAATSRTRASSGFRPIAGGRRSSILRLEEVEVAAAGDVEGVPAVAGIGGQSREGRWQPLTLQARRVRVMCQ